MARLPGLRPLAVLGATGSIGRQALEVAQRLAVDVAAIAARRGSEDFADLAAAFPGATVVVAAPTPTEESEFATRFGGRFQRGADAVVAAASEPGRTVVNGIVGSAGLPASVAALRSGNRLALANKESLVAGGPVVIAARDEGGGELVPVDSEHSALAQCLLAEETAAVRRLILTASGGPFRGRTADELAAVTPAQALDHPTWDMGPRITIDSATLMNKALEVIEAHYLFGIGYDRIDVVVHPQSIVHSVVEFVDGSLKAQLGSPDMRVPIQWAITYPYREESPYPEFDLAAASLTFEPPDRNAFPCLDLGYAAGRQGGSAPAVLNAADEVAVQAFLTGQIGFSSIPVVVERALDAVPWRTVESVEDVLAVDREARAVAKEAVGRFC